MTATALTLPDQFKTAIALVERVNAIKVIKTDAEVLNAKRDLAALIQAKKDLKEQYDALECVIEAKKAQAFKVDLEKQFEASRDYLKNGPMLAYDRAEEAKTQAEERRLAAIKQAKIDKENARLAAIAKIEQDEADKEAARLAGIAARTRDASKKDAAIKAAAEAKQRAADAESERQRQAAE